MDRTNIPMHRALLAAYCACYLVVGHAADEKTTPANKVSEKEVGASKSKVDDPSAATSKAMKSNKSSKTLHFEDSAWDNKKHTEPRQQNSGSTTQRLPSMCNSDKPPSWCN